MEFPPSHQPGWRQPRGPALLPVPSPIYRASAQLQIQRMIPQLVDAADVLPSEADREMLTVTQQRILQSRVFTPAVTARVIRWWQRRNREEDDLTQQSLLHTHWLAQEREAHLMRHHDRAWTPTPPTGDAVGEEQIRHLIRPLLRRVNVERIQKSRLLIISLEGADPMLITTIVNGWVEVYLDLIVQRKLTTTKVATAWLRTRVGEEGKRTDPARPSE